MTGRRFGTERRSFRAWGIETFADERGFTTVAAAVAILVSLTLVFTMAGIQWTSARSADVQAVADAGALAGANAVASYVTAAEVVDALVLSMGLAGMATLAVGLVLCAIPLTNAAGTPTIQAAARVFDARSSLARSAASGLQTFEELLPVLVVANGLTVVRANSTDALSYVGAAIPVPLEGSSDFGTLASDAENAAGDVAELGEQLAEGSEEAQEAQERADSAKERAWLADCGGTKSMRERASALASLPGVQNPSYADSSLWDFGVAIRRARAYYSARLANDTCANDSVEEHTRHEARVAVYGLALELVQQSSYAVNADGTVTCSLYDIPRNTAEIKQTHLYTDARWPTTLQDGVRTIHSYRACPGATGIYGGVASVAEVDAGTCARCSVCQFDVTDLGLVTSPTTNTAVGFEYYWKQVVEASRDYQQAVQDQAKAQADELSKATQATQIFESALSRLGVPRVKLAPPGRYGCICVVYGAHGDAQQAFDTSWSNASAVPSRVALSAAALVKDEATSQNNVVADLFDGLADQGGLVGGVSSVLDDVMGLWGTMLVSYGDAYEALSSALNTLFAGMRSVGLGSVASSLQSMLQGAVDLVGLEPADMSAKKPVLVNSSDVAMRVGENRIVYLRTLILAAASLDSDASLSAVLSTVGVSLRTLTGSNTITIAELTIPGTSITFPLELDLSWLSELDAA